MCAICGIIKKDGIIDPEILKRMVNLMSYRGPDEEGYYIKNSAGLGHRRLKIIDLSTGQQPMSNETGRLHLICNGEVYNFKALRQELNTKGHRFKSNSDSEVILHLYEEKGVDCLQDLRGMFALAIWDEEQRILFLARDRVGEKPLVYSLINQDIVFASEIKSLLLYPEIKKQISLPALDLYLTYQAVPSDYTIFKNIKKLPSASYLLWKDGNVRIEKYWDVDFSKKIRFKTEKEYEELLWENLQEATRIRMISDVPLGAFLSGGLDSSAIVGIMSRLSSSKIKTFSIGFDEKDYSELKFAKIVAKHFGTEHREFIIKPDIINILPKLVWHYNEPFADSSMVPTYYISEQTKQYVTVALNGDGGDENFAGYTRYWQTLILASLYKYTPIGDKYLNFICGGKKGRAYRILKYLRETRTKGLCYAYTRRLTIFPEVLKNSLYSQQIKQDLSDFDSYTHVERIWDRTKDLKLLERMFYIDFNFYLPDVLMTKMDIATMANALEGRSPFLDHKLIETVTGFPSDLKFRGIGSKYILKKKLKGFLPDKIIKRNKMGFGIPINKWFRSELKNYIKEVLYSNEFMKRGFFDPEGVKQMIEEHISGKQNHGLRIWSLLCLELWFRTFYPDAALAHLDRTISTSSVCHCYG
jgi:asparagine synthase (glutamine-hydrolysing)